MYTNAERALIAHALHTLDGDVDSPASKAAVALRQLENRPLLASVLGLPLHDAGLGNPAKAPGDDAVARLYEELNRQLEAAPGYRLVLQLPERFGWSDDVRVSEVLAEAQVWLARVPALRSARLREVRVLDSLQPALRPADLVRLVDGVRERFRVTDETMIHVQYDPSRVSRQTVRELGAAGVNRLRLDISSRDAQLAEHVSDLLGAAQEIGMSREVRLRSEERSQSIPRAVAHLFRLIGAGVEEITHDTTAGLHAPRAAEQTALRRTEAVNLGYRFRLRDAGVKALEDAGYLEGPATVFVRADNRWVHRFPDDPYRPAPRIEIGRRGRTDTGRTIATIERRADEHGAAVRRGDLPFETIRVLDDRTRETRALARAISQRPLSDSEHHHRTGRPLLAGPWGERIAGLERRGFVEVDHAAGLVALTPLGRALLPWILKAEIRPVV